MATIRWGMNFWRAKIYCITHLQRTMHGLLHRYILCVYLLVFKQWHNTTLIVTYTVKLKMWTIMVFKQMKPIEYLVAGCFSLDGLYTWKFFFQLIFWLLEWRDNIVLNVLDCVLMNMVLEIAVSIEDNCNECIWKWEWVSECVFLYWVLPI